MCLKKEPLASFLIGTHIISSYIPFSMVFPMLPDEMERHDFNLALTGLVLAVFSIPTLILALCFNRIIHRYGRRCIYLVGLYVITLGALIFALLEFIDSRVGFLIVAILGRLVMGYGMFHTKTIIFPIASKRFPKNVDGIYTIIYVAMNIAVGLGPLMGNAIYKSLDSFFWPIFIVISINLAIFVPIAHIVFPAKGDTLSSFAVQRVDSAVSVQSQGSQDARRSSGRLSRKQTSGLRRVETTMDERTIPICLHLNSFKVILLYMVVFWNFSYQLFWWGTLSLEMEDRYHSSDSMISFAYILRSLTIIPSAIFEPALTRRVGHNITIFIGCLIHFLSYIFIGPSRVLGFPESESLILVGLALKGLGDPLQFIPVFPELIEFFRSTHEGKWQIGPATDVISALGSMTIEAGVIFGTILGFVLYATIGFRYGSDIFFFMQIPMLILFTFCGGVVNDCKRLRRGEVMLRRQTTEIEVPATGRQLKEEQPEELGSAPDSNKNAERKTVNEF